MDIRRLVYGFWNAETHEVFDRDEGDEVLHGYNYRKLSDDEWDEVVRTGYNPCDYIRERFPASGTGMADRLQYVSVEDAAAYAASHKVEGK